MQPQRNGIRQKADWDRARPIGPRPLQFPSRRIRSEFCDREVIVTGRNVVGGMKGNLAQSMGPADDAPEHIGINQTAELHNIASLQRCHIVG